MIEFEVRHLLALLNLLLCTGIGICCVCRLARMHHKTTRQDVRAYFSVLLTGATASGFSPLLFAEWPGWGHLSLALGILLVLFAGRREWRVGLPEYARSAPAPLDALDSLQP